jgi:hypothetical protein
MSVRKRIASSREERAKARAKRREERRRAERAKRDATAGRGSRRRPERRTDGTAKRGWRPKPAGKPAARRDRSVAAEARKVGGGVVSVGAELAKLAREMLVIPVQLWLAAAEPIGAVVLQAWLRVLRPLAVLLWSGARACVRFGERHLTPARAVAVVAVVAAGSLAASQWLDYHSVSVGIDAYAGSVGTIAPAPEVETEIAGNAHGWVMVPLAVAAVVALVLAVTGRRRVALLLVPIGLCVVAVALAVDAPKGLDEGSAALAYQGARASLLEGFWLQLAAAVVLIACGLLLPRYLRPQAAAEAGAAAGGPTLFEKLGRAGRRAAGRRPALRLPKGSRPKRKVEGART